MFLSRSVDCVRHDPRAGMSVIERVIAVPYVIPMEVFGDNTVPDENEGMMGQDEEVKESKGLIIVENLITMLGMIRRTNKEG